jgi:hypothetical protein
MAPCKHSKLVLLASPAKKIRCRHCHLTMDEKDLSGDYCPECYEVEGVRRREFETVENKVDDKTRYACETCGAIITS